MRQGIIAVALIAGMLFVACGKKQPAQETTEEPAGQPVEKAMEPASEKDKASSAECDEPVEGKGTEPDDEPPVEDPPDEGKPAPDDAKAGVQALMKACEAMDIEAAAGHVVYRGDDQARRWKDVCNVKNADEMKYVEKVCKDIKAMLDMSESHTFEEYESETESEGTWHVWVVLFKHKGGTEEVAFAMLEVGGVFALGDID